MISSAADYPAATLLFADDKKRGHRRGLLALHGRRGVDTADIRPTTASLMPWRVFLVSIYERIKVTPHDASLKRLYPQK